MLVRACIGVFSPGSGALCLSEDFFTGMPVLSPKEKTSAEHAPAAGRRGATTFISIGLAAIETQKDRDDLPGFRDGHLQHRL
jgi:hypothetical protein